METPAGRLALILDETIGSSNLFIEHGFIPVRYSHWGINTGQTNTIGAELKAQKYAMVWIDFPKLINKDRRYNHITTLVNWAQTCADNGIPYVILGSFGKKWDDPQLLSAVDRGLLQRRHHRLCYFGLKINMSMTEPSSTCFVTLATFRMPAHPCRCGLSQQDHTMDLKLEPPSTTNKHVDRAQLEIMGYLLRSCLEACASILPVSSPGTVGVVTPYNSRTPDSDGTLVSPSPDAEHSFNTTTDQDNDSMRIRHDHKVKHLRKTRKQQLRALYNNEPDIEPHQAQCSTTLSHAYPTDARERQKIKEKENKAKGIEPVKQIKHVEEHYDDCGNDLSGLGPNAEIFLEEYAIEEDNDAEFEDDAHLLGHNLNV